MSAEAKEFVRGLLHLDPERRMTAAEALGHSWLLNGSAAPAATNLAPSVSNNLVKHFDARRKLRATIGAYRAAIKLAGKLNRTSSATSAAGGPGAAPAPAPASGGSDAKPHDAGKAAAAAAPAPLASVVEGKADL